MMDAKIFYFENEKILLTIVSKAAFFSWFVLNLVQPNIIVVYSSAHNSQILFHSLYALFFKGAPIQKYLNLYFYVAL